MKLLGVVAGGAALGGLGIALASGLSKVLEVNGKSTPGGVLESQGKVYVSLDALRAAGAQVQESDAKISIQFLPIAGRDQVDAVEGNLQHWVQNDLWRVRVESVQAANNPFGKGPGFVAKIEFRNLSKRAISPFASGMDKLQILDDRDQVAQFNQGTFKQFFKDVPPGGSAVETLGFGSQDAAIADLGKPTKLMIFFRSSGGKKAKDLRIFLDPKS